MDHPNAMNRLRHKTRRPRGSLSAVHLRSQHFFLNMSCKQCDQRQNRQQSNRKSAVFLPEHCVNTDHRAGVCKHADDTGGKQRFQRINISDKLTKKWKIDRLKVFGTIRNVAVWKSKEWTYWDPETGGLAPRTYTLGVNLTF